MGISSNNQAAIAFKNLLGKSNTDPGKDLGAEEEGIFFNVNSSNVWASVINETPSTSVSDGVAVYVEANLSIDTSANGYAYFATWPSSAPSGTDPKTSSAYAYGVGLLTGISSGDRVRNAISPSYGYLYEAKPYATSSLISPDDARNWIYQYNSGVFFQQTLSPTPATPTSINLYYYSGLTLASTSFFGATGATGPGDRYSTFDNYTSQTIVSSGTMSFSVESGLAYSLNQAILISGESNKYMNATVDSYNKTTGQLDVTITGSTGSGTFTNWIVNLAGAVGAAGSNGSSGTSGSSGSSGTSGIDGSNGSSGSSGTSGIDGSNGSSGSSGTSGANGSNGSSGTSGSTGSSGTSGSTGSSGTSGIDGSNGSSGTSGSTGSSGTSGIDGSAGSSGTSGINGSRGTSGSSGTSGIDGSNGSSGSSGTSGSTGSSGTSGSSGSSGTSGSRGSSGTSGSTGSSGTSGSTGSSGTSGSTGSSGTSGSTGSSGTSGSTGSSGTSGSTGSSGTSGSTGSSGTSGSTGSSGSSGTSGVDGSNGSSGTSGSTGSSGTSGSSGSSGTSGSTGSSGSSGTSGVNGSNGSSGTSGSTGSSGTSGSTGSSGTSGSTGSSGTSGSTGSSGTSGSTGSSGTSGSTGSSGSSGTSGVNGSNGSSGTSGLNGSNGSSGTSGSTGSSGTSGSTGSSGTSGSTGSSGTSGSTGSSGTSGSTGSSGTSGSTGSSGTSGANGSNGSSGTSGVNGSNGSSGTSGSTGSSGTSGSTGSSGTSGSTGSSGTSGVNGSNGSSGTSGSTGSSGTSGVNGSNGSSGTSGVNGSNGSSGTSGSTGSSGTSGANGSNGSSGTSGSTGSSGTSGSTGSSGTSGSTGSSGTSGVNGSNGSSGTSGSTGSSGTSGSTGSSGTSGSTGSSGTSGSTGSSGTSGSTGSSGTSGSTGSSGTSGANGSNGSSGTSGSTGSSGTSGSTGSSGTSGSTGSSGTSGSSGTGFNTIITPGNNRILTANGAATQSAIGQSNLTFDGSVLTVIGGTISTPNLIIGSGSLSTTSTNILVIESDGVVKYRSSISLGGSNGSSGTSGSTGSSGTSGSTGSSGTSGSTGSSGTSGANGSNGSSGTSGANGSNGSSGTSGSTGSSGTSGSTGSSGTSGSTGSSGTSGSTGSSGTSGSTGSSGTSGANGSNGSSGTSGVNGSNGSSGTSGVNGSNGSSGTSGSTGSSGTSGSTGSSGTSGSTGSSGTSGSTGSSGTSGSTGSSGTSGSTGSSGTSGANGSNGSSGTSGANGSNGSSGTSGSTGSSGTSGSTGSSGTSGVNGSNGSSGTSGVNGVSDRYATTSTNSKTITGPVASMTFSVATALAYTANQVVLISAVTASNTFMNATVTSYNSGSGLITVSINSANGSGTYASWTVNLAGASGGNGSAGSSGTSGSTGSSGTSGSTGSSGTSGSSGSSGTSGLLALTGTTNNGIITLDGLAPNATVESNMTFDGSLLTVSASSYFIGSIDQGPFGTINIPSLATDNWYQLGTVSNDPGRGAARLIISYIGNFWAPTTYVIDAFKDYHGHPNTATTLALQKFGTYNYIKEIRIVYNNVSTFFSLEGLFEAHGIGHTASVYTQNLLGLSSDWKFRTGTLPVTTLTTDPTNANWIARSTFPVSNGGSTLERLQINDNKYGKYWNLFDAGGSSSYQLDIRNASASVMSFDGDQYKVSIGAPTGPTATDGKLRIFGGTNSNVLDLVHSNEAAFKYRIRTLATQANLNPDMNRLGLGIPGAPTQVAFSSGLWHDNVENASIKFWRGGASMDGFLTLNTFGDSIPGTTGTASERLLIRNTGQVVVNPYGYFTASAAILSGKGASASLNVFAINSNNTLNSPYLLALYALDNQWPILTKNPTATDQPDQFFVRHAGSDVHMGNARLGGLLIMTQSNVAVNTNLIVGTHTTPGAKLDVRANAAYGAFRMQDTTQGPGRILVSDADGDGSWTASSAILASANGLTGSGTINYVPYWKSSNNLSATSSLYISNDNVMVGTVSGTAKFNVFGNIYAGSTQSTKMDLVSGAGVRTYIAAEGGGAGFGSLSNHPVVFYQNDIERARIHTGGYFGIGTQSPGANLEVWNPTDSVVWINSTVNSYLKLKRGSLNADAHISFNTTTAEKHIVGLINNNDILVLGGSEATPVIAVSGSNVGIGTITPTAKLTVQGSFLFGPTTLGTTYFRSWDYGTEFDMSGIGVSGGWARSHRITTVDTSGSIFFGAYGSDATFERAYWTIGTPGATEAGHAFTTGIHLLKNGNVGIGTFAPSSRLHVAHNNTYDLPNLIIGETIDTNARSSGIAFKTNWSGQAATSSIVFDYYGSYFTASQGVFSHGLNYVSGRSSFSNHIFRDSSLNIQMIISDSGNVGIGATAPNVKLNVAGSIMIASGLTNSQVRPAVSASTLTNGEIRSYSATNPLSDDGFLRISAGGGFNANAKAYIDLTGYSNVNDMNCNIVLGSGGLERMRIDRFGNVGIGMAPTASARLAVSGTVSTTSDIVLTSNASYIYTKNTSGALTRSFGLNGSNNLYIGGVDAAITGILFNNTGVDQMYILANGNVGIGTGTADQGARLTVRAASASGLEDIARFEVGNDTNSYLKILNGTGATAVFIPTIEGKQSANQEALFLTAQGTLDTGTTPIMVFDSRINATASVTRPLFRWNNFSTPVMTMNASGNLGIGTASPNNKLQVVGTASVSNFIMTGASPATNKVLTSIDTSGAATWSTPASVVANASGVTGSGTANYVTFWKSSNNLSATSSIYIDSTSGNVGIGQLANENFTLDIKTMTAIGSASASTVRLKGGFGGSAYYGTKSGATSTTLYAFGDSAAISGGTRDVLTTLYSTVDMNFFIGSSEAMRINATSKNVSIGGNQSVEKFNVYGKSFLSLGYYSAVGVNTGVNTNNWYRVCSFTSPVDPLNEFDYATFLMRVDVGGPANGQQISADVYINYKQQGSSFYAYINIVNYGSLQLLAEDIEIYRNNTAVTIYHRCKLTYQIPFYTYSGTVPSTLTNLATSVGANLSGEINNTTWTQKVITNGFTSDVKTGNFGIGTTGSNAKLEVFGGGVGTFSSGSYLPSMIIKSDYQPNYESVEFGSLRTATGSGWTNGGFRIQEKIDSTWMAFMQFNGDGNNNGISFGAGSSTVSRQSVPTRMIISATGNVGIGTTTPSEKLDVNGSIITNDTLRITKGASDTIQLGSSVYLIGNTGSSYTQLQQGVGRFTIWGFNGSVWGEKLTINSTTGNVGIGTTGPNAKLDVSGSINILSPGANNLSVRPAVSGGTLTNGEIRAYSATGSTWDDGFLRISAGGGTNAPAKAYIDISGYSQVPDMDCNIVLGSGGLERMRVDRFGNVGIGVTVSNARLNVRGTTSSNGSTVFKVDGNAGELFTIVDSLTGSLFSVNDISGLPIIETFSDSTTLIGSYLAPSLYTTKKVALTAGVTTTIYSIATASYNSAYFDYNAINATNARAGSIMAIWNGASYEFTESTTTDIGNTTGLTFSFSIGSGFANLRALSSASGWVIKTIIRSI